MKGPMELEEGIFEGLELEEPSARADAAVAALARKQMIARRIAARRMQRILLLGSALAAGIVFALLILAPRDRAAPDRATEPAVGAVSAAAEVPAAAAPSLEDVAELRTELDEIGELAALIPDDLVETRDEIAERIRVCRNDLESLELKLQGFDPRSAVEPERKETRI